MSLLLFLSSAIGALVVFVKSVQNSDFSYCLQSGNLLLPAFMIQVINEIAIFCFRYVLYFAIHDKENFEHLEKSVIGSLRCSSLLLALGNIIQLSDDTFCPSRVAVIGVLTIFIFNEWYVYGLSWKSIGRFVVLVSLSYSFLRLEAKCVVSLEWLEVVYFGFKNLWTLNVFGALFWQSHSFGGKCILMLVSMLGLIYAKVVFTFCFVAFQTILIAHVFTIEYIITENISTVISTKARGHLMGIHCPSYVKNLYFHYLNETQSIYFKLFVNVLSTK